MIIPQVMDKKAETLSLWLHVAITVVLLTICTAFILIMLSQGLAAGEAFTLTLDLTGGVGGSFTGFIMPSAIYLKVCIYVYMCICVYVYLCICAFHSH